MSLFDPGFEYLPVSVPLFPLGGALLLPRGVLPLNIFEPRYLSMVDDAMATGRIIAMIQPREAEPEKENPPIYGVGCAGRIIAFEETEDGRFLIHLRGLCRFDLVEELPLSHGYRRARVDWKRFKEDMTPPDETIDNQIDRDRLLKSLKSYFKLQGVEGGWEAMKEASNERLIHYCAMVCPFSAPEKQAILEADTLGDRASVLTALAEMAVLDTAGDEGKKSQQ